MNRDSVDPEKLVPCYICDLTFSAGNSLKRHLKIHSKNNYICVFCQAYFRYKQHLGVHIHQKHTLILKKRIKELISQFKSEGKAVTYVAIADKLNVPRSLIGLPPFKDIFIKEEKYRVRWFEVSRLPEKEREQEQAKIIQKVITELKRRKEKISQLSIANEIGVSREIFRYNSKIKQIVNQNRTLIPKVEGKIGKDSLIIELMMITQQLNDNDQRISCYNIACLLKGYKLGTRNTTVRRVATQLRNDPEYRQLIEGEEEKYEGEKKQLIRNAVQELKEHRIEVTVPEIRKRTGLPKDYLYYNGLRSFLKELGCNFEFRQRKVTLDQIKGVIEALKGSNQVITKVAIREKLQCNKKKLQTEPLKSFIENEIQKQKEELENQMQNDLISVLKDLFEREIDISFRKVSKQLNIHIDKIIYSEDNRKLVEDYKKRQENGKKQKIIIAIHSLKEERKRISYKAIHRKTGLSLKYIEGKENKILIKQLINQLSH
ncbi:MAG: hypothetical protein ACXADA_15055 [Candidatus Hodarchaeales archaeon]